MNNQPCLPGHKQAHPLSKTVPIRPLKHLRRPIFWAYYSQQSKRLHLLKKNEEKRPGHIFFTLSQKAKDNDKFIDFIEHIKNDITLLVGEGNLSFSVSLAKNSRIEPSRLTATTFESESTLVPNGAKNAKILRFLQAKVYHKVDATCLKESLGNTLYDCIVFQFPHTGCRMPIEAHNPNFILVKNFLLSAKRQLSQNGKILITAVDSPHYRGAFQFEKAAEISGLISPESYLFDPSKFHGYHHTMTHENGSSIEKHNQFRTWIFRQKTPADAI
jgi:25S rRNA (uracil2634-N3)-methyltransferase